MPNTEHYVLKRSGWLLLLSFTGISASCLRGASATIFSSSISARNLLHVEYLIASWTVFLVGGGLKCYKNELRLKGSRHLFGLWYSSIRRRRRSQLLAIWFWGVFWQ
ncbi:hypothetical protein H4I95_00987 [Botrytis cinerea]